MYVAQVFAYNTEQQDSQQIMILIRFVFCSYDFISILNQCLCFVSNIDWVLISRLIQHIWWVYELGFEIRFLSWVTFEKSGFA